MRNIWLPIPASESRLLRAPSTSARDILGWYSTGRGTFEGQLFEPVC